MMRFHPISLLPFVVVVFLIFSIVVMIPTTVVALSSTNGGSSAAKLLSIIDEVRAQHRVLLVPGVYDALSSKILQQQGNAKALFVSGFGVSASRLGMPDAGIITLTEMQDAARSCIQCTEGIPILVDGDTGYGGASNVRHTIRSLASIGAAAVSIEDQIFPKRCTYVAGASVNVLPREDAIKRIKVALHAKTEAWEKDGNRILLIARTDCRRALGVDEAIHRCQAFEEMGADIVYAEALQSKQEYKDLQQSLADKTTVTMIAQVQQEAGDRSMYSSEEIRDLGYDIALHGVTALQATVKALMELSSTIRTMAGCENEGHPASLDTCNIASFADVREAVGFPELEDFEANFD